MDPSHQEVYFVELDGLDDDSYSEVINILHGHKESSKVEFPWETNLNKEKDVSGDMLPSKSPVIMSPRDVLMTPVEASPMMVPYAIVSNVVPIPTVVAAPYAISPGGLVNGVPGAYGHPCLHDGPLLQPDCIIEMPSPAKSDVHYNVQPHCNGPIIPPPYKLVQEDEPQRPNAKFYSNPDVYVSHTFDLSNDNKPDSTPHNKKNSLDEAIKSSRIFSQVLGNSEPSTGISFLTDDTGISFLVEDQIGEPDISDGSHLVENIESRKQYHEPAPKVSIGNIEVTVSIDNHEKPDIQVECREYSETVHMESCETEKAVEVPVPNIENTEKVHEINQISDKEDSPVQTPAPIPPKSKSWAGLFKGTPSKATVVYENRIANPVNAVITTPHVMKHKEDKVLMPVAASEDSATSELGALLSHIRLSHASVALQPRGLINNSNWCYINSTLQALIACPPFYHLMKKLSDLPALSRGSSSTPILDSLLQFVSEFHVMPRHYEPNGHKYDKNHKNFDLEPGQDFEPKYIHNMLQIIEINPAFKLGRQEDAEEFLSILLDGLHEEMVAAINSLSSNKDIKNTAQSNGVSDDVDDDEDEDDDSWEQVGPKNKSVVTRRAIFSKTPIADIFAGQMRSVVSKTGSKESATLQPYFTLQLDIQGQVFSVKDALEGLVSKEIVEDFFDKKTNQKIEIMRKTTLEELPPVLILHLKCFVYNMDGSQKLLKNIDFDVDLKITKDLVSSTAKIPTSHRSYKLFAVVYHHGVKSTGGHYTTVVFHPGINGWIHIDDRRIETVSVQKVLKYTPPRMPYLLYYRRTDLTYS